MTINSTGKSGYAGAVSKILKNFGFISSQTISCAVFRYSKAYDFDKEDEVARGFWGSGSITRTLSVKLNYLAEAAVVDAVNYSQFVELFQLQRFNEFQNPFANFESIGTFVENTAERITTVFIKKDISLKINDNFVDILKYIEKNSSLTTPPGRNSFFS